MKFSNVEAIENTIEVVANMQEVFELTDLQLAAVGGGCAEVGFA